MLNEINQDYWLKKGREMNNECYYPYSLMVQAQGGDLIFQYPFATCCNSKVSEGSWSLKNVFACFNKSF